MKSRPLSPKTPRECACWICSAIGGILIGLCIFGKDLIPNAELMIGGAGVIIFVLGLMFITLKR